MEKIMVTGFKFSKEVEGICLESELQWAKNVEDFHHLKNGQYATTQTPTENFHEVWEINGERINLTKYIRQIGKWKTIQKTTEHFGIVFERVFNKTGTTAEYVVAGLEDNEVLVNYKSALSQAASALGKLGGSAKTEAKSTASRANGKLGGRPRKAKEE